jgi:SAM-dependent methyltransferase
MSDVSFIVECEGVRLKLTLKEKHMAKPIRDSLIRPFLRAYNKKMTATVQPPDVCAYTVDGILVSSDQCVSELRGDLVELRVVSWAQSSKAAREATRDAYEKHIDKVVATGSDPAQTCVTAFAILAMAESAAVSRAAGVPEPPSDPSHPGPGGPTPRRVLDIGCGLGAAAANFTMLCQEPAHIVGVDISPSCIEYAKTAWQSGRRGTRLSFVAADVAELPSGALDSLLGVPDGGSFDLVYANAALLHLPPRDMLRVLRALRPRVDQARGVLVASFIAFTLSSLQPRKGGGYAKLRGLASKSASESSARVGAAQGAPLSEDAIEAACAACARLGLPLRPTDGNERALAALYCDEHTMGDDGAGEGVEVFTGSEFVPGVYERHYTLESMRALVECAGWTVRVCMHNAADESTGNAGSYIYLVAQPGGA